MVNDVSPHSTQTGLNNISSCVFLENLCNIMFLVDIDGDYFSIETFTGHLTYWISYSHNTVELCDEHPTQAVVTTPIEIELQPVFYGKSI